MAITATQVKELRERTGVGMMECKKALVETDGDMDAAVKLLRQSGAAKADKKAGRIATEGIVRVAMGHDGKQAIIVEINCETDFVARDENFIHFADTVAKLAVANAVSDISQLVGLPYDGGDQTIEQVRQALVAKLGENITLRRLKLLKTADNLTHYIHGTRIGVIADYKGGDAALGKDLAMHIAASRPMVVDPKDVPQDSIAKEKEIFKAQAEQSGKSADIMEKMIVNRVKKYVDEVSLLGQKFVKDPNLTVAKWLQQQQAQVNAFVRFEVGEGIEKQSTDFAAEVMAQVKG